MFLLHKMVFDRAKYNWFFCYEKVNFKSFQSFQIAGITFLLHQLKVEQPQRADQTLTWTWTLCPKFKAKVLFGANKTFSNIFFAFCFLNKTNFEKSWLWLWTGDWVHCSFKSIEMFPDILVLEILRF